MRQLDLFDRPSASIHWFPIRHRKRFLSIVARNLLAREGDKRRKRWRLEANRIYADLILAGFRDQDFIQEELRQFREAVDAEMRRQVITEVMAQQNGGAA